MNIQDIKERNLIFSLFYYIIIIDKNERNDSMKIDIGLEEYIR
jgi:hypothetical protein